MWYSVNFDLLSKHFLPLSIRKPKIMALFKAYITPLITVHYNWTQVRNANIYTLDHNWQVCYMRGALNDRFDTEQRRIYIDGTGGDANKTYIYTPAENQTKYLGTIYIFNSLEFEDTGADFLVYVPASIVAAQSYELVALIEKYKLGGKRYLIIEI